MKARFSCSDLYNLSLPLYMHKTLDKKIPCGSYSARDNLFYLATPYHKLLTNGSLFIFVKCLDRSAYRFRDRNAVFLTIQIEDRFGLRV